MKLLKNIIELVDRDVAATVGRPISMIGLVIPFLPFMLFVDGAPADRFPILSGLAFAMSLAWGSFVMWRMLRHIRTGFEGHGYVIGSGRFWKLVTGTLLLVLLVAAALMGLRSGSSS